MSNNYATIISMPMEGAEKFISNLEVTAFVGGEYGRCIQLTTKNDIVCLSERQISDLIRCLRCRLNNKITATGTEELGEFRPQRIQPIALKTKQGKCLP